MRECKMSTSVFTQEADDTCVYMSCQMRILYVQFELFQMKSNNVPESYCNIQESADTAINIFKCHTTRCSLSRKHRVKELCEAL